MIRASVGLEAVVPREVHAFVQRGDDRGADRRLGMAVDTGGELAQEIEVFVAVGIPQPASLAADDAERKRIVEKRRPGVAARKERRGGVEALDALRIPRRVGLALDVSAVVDAAERLGQAPGSPSQ